MSTQRHRGHRDSQSSFDTGYTDLKSKFHRLKSKSLHEAHEEILGHRDSLRETRGSQSFLLALTFYCTFSTFYFLPLTSYFSFRYLRVQGFLFFLFDPDSELTRSWLFCHQSTPIKYSIATSQKSFLLPLSLYEYLIFLLFNKKIKMYS